MRINPNLTHVNEIYNPKEPIGGAVLRSYFFAFPLRGILI